MSTNASASGTNTGTRDARGVRRIGETDFAFEDPRDDIRGYAVKDSLDEGIGAVDDLLVDASSATVRFLRVGHGGILGIGREHSLIPVDAITTVDDENREVYVNASLEKIGQSPVYDPQLTVKPDDLAPVYDHYGYPRPWDPGYTYPSYRGLRVPLERGPLD